MRARIKPRTKLLFICSMNIDRSPTAEYLFRASDQYEAKSAGIYNFAIKQVDAEMIDWADIIFVMNEKSDKHLTFLKENFNTKGKKIYDLDIPNIYKRDDPELIKLLKEKIDEFIGENINLWK